MGEWRGRVAFAAFAEAIGVGTNQVLAAWRNDEGLFALYSVDELGPGDDPRALRIFQARLDVDADGILVTVGEPEEAGTFRDYLGGESDFERRISGGELDWEDEDG